mgnify:FL=1
MLFEKILYFCRKKAASQQSEQAQLRSVCTFLHLKGVFFLRVQIDCIMAFYFCIQIITVRPLGRGINKIIRTMEKTNIYTDEERYWMTGGRTGTLPTRIIPSVIYSLAPNEIFVFGSNALGMHHAGAARVAYNEFGAEWGNGEGLQGQSYSIPTMEGEHNTKLAIMRFTQYAREHPELKFLVTPVGCGIAGNTPEEIAPMFKDAAYLENVYLPISFWKVLMKI